MSSIPHVKVNVIHCEALILSCHAVNVYCWDSAVGYCAFGYCDVGESVAPVCPVSVNVIVVFEVV